MKAISFLKKINFITTACWVVVVLFIGQSCAKQEVDRIDAVVDRSAMPKLHVEDFTTVISDSGVTRYRISAPQCDIYDRATQPYWEFPVGINVEQFDENLKVQSNIFGNYARFNENEQLWEIKGKVKMMNIKGEQFETERLFWSQRDERLYSDTLVKITQTTHIINALGFESNQQMTKYVFRETKGIFPVEEK